MFCIALTLTHFVVFFTESLSALEDKDLDALMADLVADINDVEQRTLQAQKTTSDNQQSTVTQPSTGLDSDIYSKSSLYVTITGRFEDDLPPPPPHPDLDLPPPPPPPPPEPVTQVSLDGTCSKRSIVLIILQRVFGIGTTGDIIGINILGRFCNDDTCINCSMRIFCYRGLSSFCLFLDLLPTPSSL